MLPVMVTHTRTYTTGGGGGCSPCAGPCANPCAQIPQYAYHQYVTPVVQPSVITYAVPQPATTYYTQVAAQAAAPASGGGWNDLLSRMTKELSTDTMEIANLKNQLTVDSANSEYLDRKYDGIVDAAAAEGPPGPEGPPGHGVKGPPGDEGVLPGPFVRISRFSGLLNPALSGDIRKCEKIVG